MWVVLIVCLIFIKFGLQRVNMEDILCSAAVGNPESGAGSFKWGSSPLSSRKTEEEPSC